MTCEGQFKPFLPEGSDSQLVYHVVARTSCWDETDVDLTDYDKVILTIKYSDWNIVDIEWEIDQEHKYIVTFDILSESTAWRVGKFKAEIWWISWAEKHRFNEETIIWEVLDSLKIPEWIVSE